MSWERVFYALPDRCVVKTDARLRRAVNFWLLVVWLVPGFALWLVLRDALWFVGVHVGVRDLGVALRRVQRGDTGRGGVTVPPEPPADEFLEELIADLAQAWAHVGVDETGENVALRFARAAYGRGYSLGLEEPLPS